MSHEEVESLQHGEKDVLHQRFHNELLGSLFTDISLTRSRDDMGDSISRTLVIEDATLDIVGPPLDQVDRAVFASLLAALLVDPKSPQQSALPWYASDRQTIPLSLITEIYKKKLCVDREDPEEDILISMVKLRRTAWATTKVVGGKKLKLQVNLIDDYELFPYEENPDIPYLSYRVSDLTGQVFFPLTLTGRIYPPYLFKLSEMAAWLDLLFFQPHTDKVSMVVDAKKIREQSFSDDDDLNSFCETMEAALNELIAIQSLSSFQRSNSTFVIE